MKRIAEFFKHIIKAGFTAAKVRARDAGLIELPKQVAKGANCLNCHWWKDTNNRDVGYCNHPRVSMFVSEKQLCNLWNSNGVKTKWGSGEVVGLEEYKNLVPDPPADLPFDLSGGVVYTGEAEVSRAKNVNLITLPKDIKGAACFNCEYSSSMGWCKNSGVAQPIQKDYLCHYWDHPNAIRSKWRGLNSVQEEKVRDKTKREMKELRQKLKNL